jgi:ADP-heptose:LPS heptosyltransferase
MVNSKKILLIRNDHIGDLVLSTAVFRELKKNLPEYKITLIANKVNKSLIEKNHYIDEIWELDIAEYTLKSIWNYFKMARKIKKENFEIGIDLRGSILNSILLLWLPRIKKRISRIDAHPIIKPFLTSPIKINKNSHVTEDNLKIINKGLNLHAKDKKLEIITDKKDVKEVKEFLTKNKIKKYICCCPLTGLPEKQWSLKNWKKLIKELEKYNKKILIFGIHKEKKFLENIAKENKNCILVLNYDLRKTSLIFKNSDLIITQDGGPMHIAWVIGAKLIELHNLFLYGMNKVIPLGKNSHVIYTKNKEMNSIAFEEVKKKIKEILK